MKQRSDLFEQLTGDVELFAPGLVPGLHLFVQVMHATHFARRRTEPGSHNGSPFLSRQRFRSRSSCALKLPYELSHGHGFCKFGIAFLYDIGTQLILQRNAQIKRLAVHRLTKYRLTKKPLIPETLKGFFWPQIG